MNYKTSDIAVIIPAYNCAKTIVNTLDKIFEQRQLPGEVIVINDGSSDSTEETIKNCQHFDKIKYIYQENAGPAVARNTGIYSTEKSWVAFVDADDEWIDTGKLIAQIDLVNANSDATLIDTFARVDWHGERVIEINRVKNGSVFLEFLKSNIVNATSSVLAKTEVIKAVGGFDKDLRFGEDRLLWAQLAKRGGIYTVPVVMISKINEVGNLTSKGLKNYSYRVDLVNRLLTLANSSTLNLSDIWLDNVRDFLRLSFKSNDSDSYLYIYRDTLKHTGNRLWFSKYGLLGLYALTFRSFKPLV